jgi:hypothetical protein
MVLVQALSGMEKYQKKCQPKADGLFNEDVRSERILISESRSRWSNTSFNLACLGRQQDCPTPSARSYCSRSSETISLAERPQTTLVTLQEYNSRREGSHSDSRRIRSHLSLCGG